MICGPLEACKDTMIAKLVIMWPENPHTVGDLNCRECHPKQCICGGLIHSDDDGDYGEDTVNIEKCDRCGDNYDEAPNRKTCGAVEAPR